MKNESAKKSLEKSNNVLEEKRKIVKRKICIKKTRTFTIIAMNFVQDQIKNLHKKDTHVYNNCYEFRSRAIKQHIHLIYTCRYHQPILGENEANLSTLAMLTAIENRLEELFQQIETMPADKVAAAEKDKEQERRKKAREMKLERDRKHQEERTRKALQRANEEPKKQVGKRLVFRSQPLDTDHHDDELDAEANREEEEMRYFFQW